MYVFSILYKTKLPLIVVFNKTDIQPHEFAIEWMTDFEAFRSAVQTDESFMGSLTHSMSLVLDEFYQNLKVQPRHRRRRWGRRRRRSADAPGDPCVCACMCVANERA